MDDARFNPYSPPVTGHDADKAGSRSIWATFALAVVVLAFCVFTGLLLTSDSSDDIKAGRMFAVNVPILAAALIFAVKPRIAAYTAMLGAFVQLTITVMMVAKSIGDPAIVLVINGLIVIPLLVIAARLFVSHRPQTNRTLAESANSPNTG